jgi:hypothetical protein
MRWNHFMNGWRKVYGVTVDSEQKRPRCMGDFQSLSFSHLRALDAAALFSTHHKRQENHSVSPATTTHKHVFPSCKSIPTLTPPFLDGTKEQQPNFLILVNTCQRYFVIFLTYLETWLIQFKSTTFQNKLLAITSH